MKKNYLIVAMMSLCMLANAKTSAPTRMEQNTKTVQKADAEDDGYVIVDGFKCSLDKTNSTFSIAEIASFSGEDLVVPSLILYEGKYYHCETVNMYNLRGELNADNGYTDTKITPYVKSITFSEGIKTLKGHFALNRCKKVTIPSTVESIEYTGFNYGISAGYLDDEETSWWMNKYGINFQAFDLEEFVVSKDSKNFTANNGLLYTKDMKTLISCPRGKRGIVKVPEGVETLAVACFSICNRVTEIKLPSTIRNLGEGYGRYAGFHYCLNLEKVNIPEGVETITGGAFRHCDKLKSLTLPTTLKTLDVNYAERADEMRQIEVFGPMLSLEELNMENTNIETLEGVYYEGGDYGTLPFNSGLNIKNLRLPKKIRIIGKNVFKNVNPPAELHLPATIESLGECFINPFTKYTESSWYPSECQQTESNIKDIYCYWTTPLNVADNIFGYAKVKEGRKYVYSFPQDWADICTLHVPAGTADAYRANSVWGRFKNIVEFTPTGIDAVIENTETSKAATGIYTQQGTKVADSKAQTGKLPAGIYIVDGKKIAVRK